MTALYHYTSVDGFEGMLKNNQLRMTKSEFLNDPDDCHLLVKLVKKYLESNEKDVKNTIKNLKACSAEVADLYGKKGCDLVSYIEYIQKNLGLYVLSLTNTEDEMSMWNYYGNGGVQLKFSANNLVGSLRQSLLSEKEFLTEANVIYANTELDLEKISVPNFSRFVLMNSESTNVFEDHRSYISEHSAYEADQLYSTSDLRKFIGTYLKNYVESLRHLLQNKIIDVTTSPNVVFAHVFDNTSKMNNYYYWKHDLTLYMIVLSALIKSDTYKHENEYRIVYFENNINTVKIKKEEYGIKRIANNRFLYPYITFSEGDILGAALEGVVISPITKNLPIDNTTYCNTLKNFLVSQGINEKINVQYSKHTIRW